MSQTFFLNFLYLQKYDLFRLTYWQPCISQFCNIAKGIILLKFSLPKKRDYQLVAVSSPAITKSENFVIVTGTCKPRLPALIYNTPLMMPQNCEKRCCQWYVIKQIKTYFRIVESLGKGLRHLCITSGSSRLFNKTDFEQYLLTITKNTCIKINCLECIFILYKYEESVRNRLSSSSSTDYLF